MRLIQWCCSMCQILGDIRFAFGALATTITTTRNGRNGRCSTSFLLLDAAAAARENTLPWGVPLLVPVGQATATCGWATHTYRSVLVDKGQRSAYFPEKWHETFW
jgi:hypothetical protein